MVITTQFNVLPCCTAAQTSSVPLRVAFECALGRGGGGSIRPYADSFPLSDHFQGGVGWGWVGLRAARKGGGGKAPDANIYGLK